MFGPEARMLGVMHLSHLFFAGWVTNQLWHEKLNLFIFFFLNWSRNAGVNSLPKVGHGKGLQLGCSSNGY